MLNPCDVLDDAGLKPRDVLDDATLRPLDVLEDVTDVIYMPVTEAILWKVRQLVFNFRTQEIRL